MPRRIIIITTIYDYLHLEGFAVNYFHIQVNVVTNSVKIISYKICRAALN